MGHGSGKRLFLRLLTSCLEFNYKKVYMNHMDGLIFTLFGGVFYFQVYSSKTLYIVGAAFVCLLGAFTFMCAIYMCIKHSK